MPIPWLAILQTIPWSEVIRNAPKVAENAKKLWSTIGKSESAGEADSTEVQTSEVREALSAAAIHARLAAVEATIADMHEQMLASSELIKSLAEQNTQLIARIELNRVRMVWLTAGVVVAGVVAISCLVLLLFR